MSETINGLRSTISRQSAFITTLLDEIVGLEKERGALRKELEQVWTELRQRHAEQARYHENARP